MEDERSHENEEQQDEYFSCESDGGEHETKSRIYREFMEGTRMFVDPKLEWNRLRAEGEIQKKREFERHARCWVYENKHLVLDQIDARLKLAETNFSIDVHYKSEQPWPCEEELFQRARATVEFIRKEVGLMAHALQGDDKSIVMMRTGYVPEDVDQPMGIWMKKE